MANLGNVSRLVALAAFALATSACHFHLAAVEVVTSDADLAVVDPPPPDLAMPASPGDDLATAPQPPLLTGTHATIPATVDLTSEGALDWVHAGLAIATDVNRKSGGAPLLTFTTSGVGGQYGMYAPAYSWTNGMPTASATTKAGIYANGVGNGFTLTLPAAATARTLNVYVTAFNAHATLTAHLSDGAVADYSDTQALGTANTFFKYSIVVRDATPNAQLVVTWTLTQAGSGYSSVDFMAATLQ